IEAVEKALSTGEFAGVIIEGIQGVSGIHEPGDDFLRKLSAATKETGTLLILDEIQSGTGRTGKYFAHQHSGIKPDIITMAKGIANGFPMGAVLIAPDIKPVKGMLGTTFGGNHLACAAAIAVADVMAKENLVQNAAETGEYLISELKKIPGLVEVRGKGLMIGVEIEGDAGALRKQLLFDHNIFTGGAGAHTVRLLPALCLTKEQADKFLKEFKSVINQKSA
ncbi:MAG: aminotransferase class III-fold pyridoxal phosphate-dependent enzyme, partial [Paramuribaculum sp.]|nr:aminotransferase class III-fold pyridoxal phosphate-dependent enzyme [Paramuribaculum sp.]